MTAISQTPILIFLFPFLGMLFLPFLGKNKKLTFAAVMFLMSAAVFFSISGVMQTGAGAIMIYKMGGWQPPFGIEWRMDGFSALMAILITGVSLTVIFATRSSVNREIKSSGPVYYMTALLHIAALIGMILTHDLFNLFVFIEVSSLTAYALIATGDDAKGGIASLRYLFIGTIAASFYLLGVGYLYSATGTLNMSDLAARLPVVLESRSVYLGFFLIFMGLAIKMGLFPFHSWLPDSYTYASDSATALIAPLMTKTAIYGFIRIFVIVLTPEILQSFGILKITGGLAAVAMIAGALMAFSQINFKRMLAYSSISHIGLIILGVSLGHPVALAGAIFHLVNHSVMKMGLFLISAAAFERHGVREIMDFGKLRGRMPFTMAAFFMIALSMTGIPPFGGFFSKWYILTGAVQSGNLIFAALIIFSSLLTALYFFKVIEQAFFQKAKKAETIVIEEASFPLVFSAGLSAVSLLVLGIFASPIFNWIMKAVLPGAGN